MTDLEILLGELGDELDLGGDDLADRVVAEIGGGGLRRSSARRPTLLRVAAVALLVVAGLLAVPSSRRAVARWLGLDGVTIERRPSLSVPDSVPDDVSVDVITLPDIPGATSTPAAGPPTADVQLDDEAGTIDAEVLTKVLGPGSSVREVDVGGRPGLWIDGEPHEMLVRDADGALVARRFAGDTLIWQDGARIVRLEGFDALEDALAYATSLDR